MSKTVAMLFVLLSLLTLSACKPSAREAAKAPADEKWAVTTGQITKVAKLDDGTYGWTLVYSAEKSTATNADGQPIKGPIEQHFLGKPRKAVDGQKIKLRYRRDEPVVFELLEEIQYEKEAK